MYFDAPQYTAGVASPLWPQDASHQQWYGHQTQLDNYWHGQQLSYDRDSYNNFSDNHRDYSKVQHWDYSQYHDNFQALSLLDNRLANQAAQLDSLPFEPEEVLVVNSVS